MTYASSNFFDIPAIPRGLAAGLFIALRRQKLAEMTDDDVRRAIADLFSGTPIYDLPPRTTSGLVEQQRLFSRLRKPA